MADVEKYLVDAEREIADIDKEMAKLAHKREIAETRASTLRMVIEAPVTPRVIPQGVRGRAIPKTPVSSRSKRAPSGSWKTVFSNLLKQGMAQFSYDDVMRSARELAMTAPKASVRVRISKFKDQGYLERVTDGVYRPTKEGASFFKE